MNESTISVRGYLGNDPVLRSASGQPVASFRLACTPRKLNRATGEWSDAPTQWYSVSAWRRLGENVAASLHKGDPVVVQGRLMPRTYVNRDGVEVGTFDIDASVVGHDLTRGRAVSVRAGAIETTAEHGESEQGQSEPLAQAKRDWGGTDIGAPSAGIGTAPVGEASHAAAV